MLLIVAKHHVVFALIIRSALSFLCEQLFVLLGFVGVLVNLLWLLQPNVTHHETPEEAGYERHQYDVKPLQLRRVEVEHGQQHAQRREEGVYTRDEVVVNRRRRREKAQIGRAHV